MKKIMLREIAHSRAGDKGNISNISVIAYNEGDYEVIKDQVTIEAVKNLYQGIVMGDIIRYELPNIGALNFVLYDALGGGVTTSLRLDQHGKSMSSLMLTLEIKTEE